MAAAAAAWATATAAEAGTETLGTRPKVAAAASSASAAGVEGAAWALGGEPFAASSSVPVTAVRALRPTEASFTGGAAGAPGATARPPVKRSGARAPGLQPDETVKT